jgi:hypothetical protein
MQTMIYFLPIATYALRSPKKENKAKEVSAVTNYRDIQNYRSTPMRVLKIIAGLLINLRSKGRDTFQNGSSSDASNLRRDGYERRKSFRQF